VIGPSSHSQASPELPGHRKSPLPLEFILSIHPNSGGCKLPLSARKDFHNSERKEHRHPEARRAGSDSHQPLEQPHNVAMADFRSIRTGRDRSLWKYARFAAFMRFAAFIKVGLSTAAIKLCASPLRDVLRHS
jgi:hypothetical protein